MSQSIKSRSNKLTKRPNRLAIPIPHPTIPGAARPVCQKNGLYLFPRIQVSEILPPICNPAYYPKEIGILEWCPNGAPLNLNTMNNSIGHITDIIQLTNMLFQICHPDLYQITRPQCIISPNTELLVLRPVSRNGISLTLVLFPGIVFGLFAHVRSISNFDYTLILIHPTIPFPQIQQLIKQIHPFRFHFDRIQ